MGLGNASVTTLYWTMASCPTRLLRADSTARSLGRESDSWFKICCICKFRFPIQSTKIMKTHITYEICAYINSGRHTACACKSDGNPWHSPLASRFATRHSHNITPIIQSVAVVSTCLPVVALLNSKSKPAEGFDDMSLFLGLIPSANRDC